MTTDLYGGRLDRAVRLRGAGRADEARELLLELRAEFPDDAVVAYQTAWVHDVLDREAEAVAHYRAAIAGDLPAGPQLAALTAAGHRAGRGGPVGQAGSAIGNGTLSRPAVVCTW